MRDNDHSFNMFVVGCVVAGFLLCLVIMIVSTSIRNAIDSISPEGIARCKSLQGEYGGGKCFKDGKEI